MPGASLQCHCSGWHSWWLVPGTKTRNLEFIIILPTIPSSAGKSHSNLHPAVCEKLNLKDCKNNVPNGRSTWGKGEPIYRLIHDLFFPCLLHISFQYHWQKRWTIFFTACNKHCEENQNNNLRQSVVSFIGISFIYKHNYHHRMASQLPTNNISKKKPLAQWDSIHIYLFYTLPSKSSRVSTGHPGAATWHLCRSSKTWASSLQHVEGYQLTSGSSRRTFWFSVPSILTLRYYTWNCYNVIHQKQTNFQVGKDILFSIMDIIWFGQSIIRVGGF